MRNILFSFLLLAVEPAFHSQYDQDAFIYTTFFEGKEEGVFVDIGAHDGISINNTLFFEQKGWKGICIEPIPEVFEELKKNRSAICVNGCIAPTTGTAEFTRVVGYGEMTSGLTAHYHPEHKLRIEQELQLHGGEQKALQVACFTLNDLLSKHQFSHVDYLSIDTEGGEFEILQSIDFEKYDIETISVENNYNDPHLKSFLVSKGYAFITKKGCDEIYKKPKLSPTRSPSFHFVQQFLPENPVIMKIGARSLVKNRKLCRFWKNAQIYLMETHAPTLARLKKRYRKKENIRLFSALKQEKIPSLDFLYVEGKACRHIPLLPKAKVIQLEAYPLETIEWLNSHGFVSLFQNKEGALFVRKD